MPGDHRTVSLSLMVVVLQMGTGIKYNLKVCSDSDTAETRARGLTVTSTSLFQGATPREDGGRICCLLEPGEAGFLGFQMLLLIRHDRCGVERQLQPQPG